MTTSRAAIAAREALAKNSADARRLAQDKGVADTRALLEASQRDLMLRIRQAEGLSGPGVGSFTAVQMRATLAQVTQVLRTLVPGIKGAVVSGAKIAASKSARNTVDYLVKADRAFRGVGVQPLAINEARMLDQATHGTRSSVLHHLATGGAPERGATSARAAPGILERYGIETIGAFEEVLKLHLISKKSWAETRASLTEQSPLLQGAPKHWAERIVRTELMGAHNRASWEANREADDQLGDVVKILAATFDDRTAADSYAVHGQIRRPEEAFETWEGLCQHPPARPNDREIMVPHRISWELPDYLAWRGDEEIDARWKETHGPKSKQVMPDRPEMTTVPIEQFGKPQSRKHRDGSSEDIDGGGLEGDDAG